MKAERWSGVKNLKTRDGRDVRIDYISDGGGSYPIRGSIKVWTNTGFTWDSESWTPEGCCSIMLQTTGEKHPRDLVWPEEGLNPPKETICSTLIITSSGSLEIFEDGTVSLRGPNLAVNKSIRFSAADFKKIVAHYWLHTSK